jgi:hypothetical protein
MSDGQLLKVSEEICDLEGPYECPHCGGHMKLDSTFIDLVEGTTRCPYCYGDIKPRKVLTEEG